MEPFFTPRNKGSGGDNSPLPKKKVGTSVAHPPHPSSLSTFIIIRFLLLFDTPQTYLFTLFLYLCVFLSLSPLLTATKTGPAVSNTPSDSDIVLPFLDTVRAFWNQRPLTNLCQVPLKTPTISMTTLPTWYFFLPFCLELNHLFKHKHRILADACYLLQTVFSGQLHLWNYQHLTLNTKKVIEDEHFLSKQCTNMPSPFSLYKCLK